MTRLIVFDWDGTLADSVDRIVAAVQGAFRDMSLPPPSFAEASGIIGLGLREGLAALIPGASEALQGDFARYYRVRFVANPAPVVLFDGVRGTLENVRRAGYRCAIATGKGRRGITAELTASGLTPYFDGVRTADDGPSKPHPQMLWALLAELETEPSDAIMVGDTTFDAEMAERAGVPFVGVTYGVHGADRLLKFQPLTLLDSITEFPPFLTLGSGETPTP